MKLAGMLRRAGRGAVIPLITVVLAFIVGGFVVLFTGHNPFTTYGAIFDGTGLNYLFPWVGGNAHTIAGFNLQQTLINAAPLILTGLSVAFAFRVGLFNIGAQGQYTVGAVMAVWIGSLFPHMQPLLHIVLAVIAAGLMGARMGGHGGMAESDGRDARGDLDDHAELDRDLGRRSACSRPAGRSRATPRPATRSPTRSSRALTCP